MTIASVITNASLTVFTMSVLDVYSTSTRFWLYVGFQWTCFAFQVGACVRLCVCVFVRLYVRFEWICFAC